MFYQGKLKNSLKTSPRSSQGHKNQVSERKKEGRGEVLSLPMYFTMDNHRIP